jgi:hypothetical protein
MIVFFWPVCLAGLFQLVVVDSGHFAQWHAVASASLAQAFSCNTVASVSTHGLLHTAECADPCHTICTPPCLELCAATPLTNMLAGFWLYACCAAHRSRMAPTSSLRLTRRSSPSCSSLHTTTGRERGCHSPRSVPDSDTAASRPAVC